MNEDDLISVPGEAYQKPEERFSDSMLEHKNKLP